MKTTTMTALTMKITWELSEVVMLDERQDILLGVWVLVSADAVRVKGEGGGLFGGSS